MYIFQLLISLSTLVNPQFFGLRTVNASPHHLKHEWLGGNINYFGRPIWNIPAVLIYKVFSRPWYTFHIFHSYKCAMLFTFYGCKGVNPTDLGEVAYQKTTFFIFFHQVIVFGEIGTYLTMFECQVIRDLIQADFFDKLSNALFCVLLGLVHNDIFGWIQQPPLHEGNRMEGLALLNVSEQQVVLHFVRNSCKLLQKRIRLTVTFNGGLHL